MYRPKIPNSGWAAFDRRLRGTADGRDDVDVNSFPALSGSRGFSSASSSAIENNNIPKAKPFASVIRPPVEFAVVGKENGNKHLTDHTVRTNFGVNSSSDNKIKLLKDAHSWADSNLIEDILAGVDNDVGQASVLLKSMVAPDFLPKESRTTVQPAFEMNKAHGSVSGYAIAENKHSNESQLLPLQMNVISIPQEPELEEFDDDYLNHRKDALKMMRAATKHSQAASNAFFRGDHAAAKELSLRAQEERSAAEKLNNNAAEEIFHLRNSNNNIWKIDMHGLHASEAVTALERHLHMLEFQPPGNNPASTDELYKSESTIAVRNEVAPEKVVVFLRPRQSVLEVITGIGRHSKGQASLPVAVRGFLIENGYRFEELRPGVFSVRPKFRRG
ncbi:uncharacterized protein LOC123426795 [Hordeum vulgare subsp. vulgare]|uniref:Uncharacterized protein n=1 Tax=Hordeum vulgare subsp. vulgare TaxID=112509 RepID=M0WT06_HORVV|nr:uncharacterized protein LOC123426795 [Hordeum vulgare subsp. vulgare]KAI5015087.1 hypothetical protein ZWY2020_056477 [Hordeum vulgare]